MKEEFFLKITTMHRGANFLSGGFITAIVVNSPEMKLAKRTSVQCLDCCKNELKL